VLFEDAAEFCSHTLDSSFSTIDFNAPVEALWDIECEPHEWFLCCVIRVLGGFRSTDPISGVGWWANGLWLGGDSDFLGHGLVSP
jgi:hypothetical protein